ncbi:MAG: dienelactone hydrolase family protein [Planctomycetes bacterium]|nr:dienelactone hydrolase family protein [Planctomycetota bacterium]
MLHSLALLALSLLPHPPVQEHSLTGDVSEAEFKAMHQLKTGEKPVLAGTPVEVGGAHCYLSLPKTPRAGSRAIVVIHEWWGLNDNIRLWADRLAADGYAALAVDLYGGVVATNSDEAMAAMKKVDDTKALAVLVAAEKFLREDPRVKAGKVASLGWCFGGGKSLLLGLNSKTLDACVLYYGFLEQDPAKLDQLACPLLGIFGAKDRSIKPTDVAQFLTTLTGAGKDARVMIFPAEHAFANPSNKIYDEANASIAWENVRMFLEQKLK